MKFELVIPTRGKILNFENLLNSITPDDQLPERIRVIIDKQLNRNDFEEMQYFLSKSINKYIYLNLSLVSNINSDFVTGQGAAYVRNFGLSLVKSRFVYLIDDDNKVGQDFFVNTIKTRKNIRSNISKDLILSPSIMYRETDKIQSAGIKTFDFLFSMVVPNKFSEQSYSQVKMIGGNSLFGPTDLFIINRFDERFEFVYEDIDFTYALHRLGYPIFVSKDIQINHMERDKSKLDRSFIGNPKDAYQKSRNRIIFAKKHATIKEKRMFMWFGLWIQSFWHMSLILFYGEKKLELWKAIINGIKDGLKMDVA